MDSTGSKGPGLHEFLIEAELQHYFNAIKTDLKVQNTAQLKYVTEEDLYQLGMSKPEVRRLKKYFNKYYPQNYLSKFKKMLLSKKDDQSTGGFGAIAEDHTVDKPPVRIPNKHIISAESIVVNKELGMGEFGVVQQGVWTNDGDRIQVAIKCLSRERMQSNPIEFLKEAAIMHSIDHENVVRLYGVVLDTDSLMLVTELAPLRSLLECLKEPSLRASFPVLTLCDFTLQICDGMQYLEAKRLIHRDLAARNILVFSKNKVKISDFGLSRALGQGKDYYQTNFNVHLKLPIAWCAPECISYLRFTSASDVWAYGVTLWEMFSYGFQPWAALTGHQILEAIDEPNYQRLEQPECCPKEYYSLMLKCWQHEPNKRPRFCEIINVLPECRPEQVQAVMASFECQDEPSVPKRDLLQYRIGDIFTVLDKGSNNSLWKGVLANGKTGLFNPAHTVAYIGTNLPTANKPDAFSRTDTKYSSRRKLRTEMISSPQGDFKHTGHVGLDGAYFGDLSFLGGNNSSQYSHLPRQVVTPYKPHEDMDQLPLLTNNATSGNGMSASSTQLGISTPDTPTSTNLHASDHIALSSRQLQHFGTGPVMEQMNGANNNINRSVRWQNQIEPLVQGDHEYHEISDEENLVNESPRFEKTFDFGPSLLDEMEVMFRNLNSPTPTTPNSPLDHDGVNKCNELRELTSRLSSVTHSSKGKKQATVKPISAADQKTLESAIALANEMTARSMNDLESEPAPTTPASPNKRKFSFRFPSGGGNSDADNSKTERRNFSEEAQSIPDLQSTLTEEAQLAYESLVESATPDVPVINQQLIRTRAVFNSVATDNPLRMLRSGNLTLIKPQIKTNSSADLKSRTRSLPKSYSQEKQTNAQRDTCHVKPLLEVCRSVDSQSFDCVDGCEDDEVFVDRDSHRNTDAVKCRCVDVPSANERTDGPRCNHLSNSDSCAPPSYSEFQTDDNPIPLPPRDRSKPKPVTKQRHTRKHPLIIPASSIQRTLNKVNVITPEEQYNNPLENLDFSGNPVKIVPDGKMLSEPSYVNHNPFEFMKEIDTVSMDRDFDTQSMHFEAQIESNLAALDNIQDDDFVDERHFRTPLAGDDVDGCNFNIVTANAYALKPDNPRTESSSKNAHPTQVHVVYNKQIEKVTPRRRDSQGLVENEEDENDDLVLRHNAEHVSCEDLLEFAGAKPSSRARGNDSDEVRIMSKVLGSEVSTEQCILALEHSNWDVHKAIKLAKLQNLLKVSIDNPFVDLVTLNGALEAHQWDLSQAASWIVAANQEGDITQV